MTNFHISFMNRSTVLTDDDLRAAMRAPQGQMRRESAHIWGTETNSTLITDAANPADGIWRVCAQHTSGTGSDSTGNKLTSGPIGVGAQLGPYLIEAVLGEGGMGKVYRAKDTRLGRPVAIKISTSRFSGRLEREARSISALNHPHVCTLYDVGPNYLVMELVEGETLSARLHKGALPPNLMLRFSAQIAGALAAVHALGITHRDLTPGNIMVTKYGIKVLDFGLAKGEMCMPTEPETETQTMSQVVLGTPAYMAPEQLEGKPCDARTDIFSMGLVFYEMAMGKRAFGGASRAALIAQVMQADPAPMESVPAQLAHIIGRCLAKAPADRWQAASDVKAELEWAASAEASVAW